MNDVDFLYEVLSDGQSHDHAEILSRSFAERGCGLTIHSRAADLRKRGLTVLCSLGRKNGRVSSSYRLLREPTERPEPKSSVGSRSGQGLSANTLSGPLPLTGGSASWPEGEPPVSGTQMSLEDAA